MSQPRILVVDDERFFRDAIQEVLEDAGLPVVTAIDGSEGLEAAADPSIGVVILDLQMPDLHGLEVFRRLRETRPGLRVIILSASTDQADVLEALRLGAFEYLAKPLHEEELTLVVKRAQETYRLAAEWDGLQGRVETLDRVLSGLCEKSSQVEDPLELCEEVVTGIADVLEVARTSVLVLDEDAGHLRVAAIRGSKHPLDDIEPVPVGQGAAGLAVARREALLVSDVAEDPRFAGQAPTDRYRTGSFAVAPLFREERAYGVLCATERSPDEPLTQQDLTLLRILAGQVSGLLRPRAMAATENLDAELLRGICEAITAEVEPTRVLDGALRLVAQRLSAAPVSLYRLDGESGLLCRTAERDEGRRADREALPRGRGLTGTVLESGALVASESPEQDPRFDAEVDTPADGAAGPMVCGPLRFRGRCLGVFRAFPTDPAAVDAEVAERLSAALSAVLRSVTLYESLVESIEEVAAARRGTV